MAGYYDNAVTWEYAQVKAPGGAILQQPTPGNYPDVLGTVPDRTVVRVYTGLVSSTFFPKIKTHKLMQTPAKDSQGVEYYAVELVPMKGEYWAAYPASVPTTLALPSVEQQKGDKSATKRRAWIRANELDLANPGLPAKWPTEQELDRVGLVDSGTVPSGLDPGGPGGPGESPDPWGDMGAWLLVLAGATAVAGAPAAVPIGLAVVAVAVQDEKSKQT